MMVDRDAALPVFACLCETLAEAHILLLLVNRHQLTHKTESHSSCVAAVCRRDEKEANKSEGLSHRNYHHVIVEMRGAND